MFYIFYLFIILENNLLKIINENNVSHKFFYFYEIKKKTRTILKYTFKHALDFSENFC